MAFPIQSIQFVAASSQEAKITDASQTGLDFTNTLTLEGWFKFTTLPSSGNEFELVTKRISTGNNRSYYWALQNNAGTYSLYWVAWSDGSSDTGQLNVTVTPSTATWYHYAVTKSGTTVKFYVNGVQQGTDQTVSSSTIFNGNADFEVGNYSEAGGFLNGRVNLLRAWSTQRTVTEIANNYCTELGATAALSGEWTFDNTYLDNSGNGNTLTAVNTPTFAADVTSTCAGAGSTFTVHRALIGVGI